MSIGCRPKSKDISCVDHLLHEDHTVLLVQELVAEVAVFASQSLHIHREGSEVKEVCPSVSVPGTSNSGYQLLRFEGG